MKVAIFWPIYYPQSNAAAVRGSAFVKFLALEGVDVSILIPKRKAFYNYQLKNERLTIVKTYDTVSESSHFIISLLFLPISIVGLIKKLKKLKPDLVMCSIPGLFLALESLIAAKYLRIPYVLDVRDTWELEIFTHPGRLKNILKMYIEKFCCVYADLIFAVTPTLKEMIVNSHKISSNKIKLVYNGADLENFSNKNKCETCDLIFVGSPSEYRDLYRLFKSYSLVLRSLPNIKFTYIGWETNEYTQKLKKYLEELDISDQNIEFIAKIPHQRIANELSKAKIGVVTLVNEKAYRSAVGAKTYEYLAAGLPIVCLGPTFECELKKLINDNKVGIYTTNPQLFAESIIYLLTNEEVRETLSENALETAKKFDRGSIIHETYVKYLSGFAKNSSIASIKGLKNKISIEKWRKSLSRFNEWRKVTYSKPILINKEKINIVKEFVEFCKINESEMILDIGCGNGGLRLQFNTCINYFGIDPLIPPNLNFAFPMVCAVGEKLPFKNNTFGCVLCTGVIDHVLSPNNIIDEAFRVTNSNGRLIVWIDVNRVDFLYKLKKAINYLLKGNFSPVLRYFIKNHSVKNNLSERYGHTISSFTNKELIAVMSRKFKINHIKYINNIVFIEGIKTKL